MVFDYDFMPNVAIDIDDTNVIDKSRMLNLGLLEYYKLEDGKIAS